MWSNIIVKYPLAVMKGDKLSDAEHELFMADIEKREQLVDLGLILDWV